MNNTEPTNNENITVEVKRKRGRPRKNPVQQPIQPNQTDQQNEMQITQETEVSGSWRVFSQTQREARELWQNIALIDGQQSQQSNALPITRIDARNPLHHAQRLEVRAPVTSIAFHPLRPSFIFALATLLGDIYLYHFVPQVPSEEDNTVRMQAIESGCGRWELIGTLRDSLRSDTTDEILSIAFSGDGRYLYAGGSLRNRSLFDQSLGDLAIVSAPLLAFRLHGDNFNTLCQRYEGHMKQIRSIKSVLMDYNIPHIVTCGEDGRVIKWRVDTSQGTWSDTLTAQRVIRDSAQSAAHEISFLPHSANRLFLLSTDTSLELYDLHNENLLACWRVGQCERLFFFPTDFDDKSSEDPSAPQPTAKYHILTRTSEYAQDGTLTLSRCALYRLTLTLQEDQSLPVAYERAPWDLQFVRTYDHESFKANTRHLALCTNGYCVLGGTSSGHVFVWNAQTAKLVAVLADHIPPPGTANTSRGHVRVVAFHPHIPHLFTAAENGDVNVYHARSDWIERNAPQLPVRANHPEPSAHSNEEDEDYYMEEEPSLPAANVSSSLATNDKNENDVSLATSANLLPPTNSDVPS